LEPSTRDEEQAPISVSGGLQVFAYLIAPGTLIGALLYYFGWVRTHYLYAYLGIDADELGFSTTDYVLRSADALWPSLCGLIVALLLLLLAHGAVRHWIDRTRPGTLWRLLILPLYVLGVVLSTMGELRFATAQQASIGSPLCLVLGFGSLAYARLLHKRLGVPRRSGQTSPLYLPRFDLMIFTLFAFLIVLNIFWGTALFAADLGRGKARNLELQPFATQPDVLLYSSHRLNVDARDVTAADLGPTYAPYRFRYDGLKLLIRGKDKIILIPYSWSTTNAFALVLPESDAIRIVFAPNF
jgi:hypothetical protein